MSVLKTFVVAVALSPLLFYPITSIDESSDCPFVLWFATMVIVGYPYFACKTRLNGCFTTFSSNDRTYIQRLPSENKFFSSILMLVSGFVK